MRLPLVLLPLLFVQGFCTEAQDEESEIRHIHENTEKMNKLMARWNKLHPVTYPPLPADVEASIKEYMKETKHDNPSISDAEAAETSMLTGGGDIIPSDEDIAELEAKLQGESAESRTKRAISMIAYANWPTDKPIPFTISEHFDDEDHAAIRTAMKTFKENTCIEFEENSDPGLKIRFLKDKENCQSTVGDNRRNWNDHHVILLSDPCFAGRASTVQHETMHALGFAHTMNRPDRNDYMYFNGKVLNPKIPSVNFKLLHPSEVNTYSLPYEYNSVMHYQAGAGSMDGTPVLWPKKPQYLKSVGSFHGPTFNDWKVINLRYNCAEKNCGNQKIDCHNNGYQHPRNCSRCACPTFYTGDFCEIEVNAVNLAPGSKPESLPYDKPYEAEYRVKAQFSEFDKDIRMIKAPEGQRIRITLDKIKSRKDFDCPPECFNNAIEIVDEDLTLVGRRFCCSHNTSDWFVSKTNVVGYKVYSAPGLGFSSQVTFSIEPSGEVPPTIGPSTVIPTVTDSTATKSGTEEPATVDPKTDEGITDINEPSTTTPTPTESTTTLPESDSPSTTTPRTDESSTDPSDPSTPNPTDSTEINHTVESETTTTQFPTNEPSESSESPQPESPTSSSSEPPSSDEELTTGTPEADQSQIGELLDSIKSLLYGVSEKVNELARKLGF